MASNAHPTHTSLPESFGHYRIIQELGKGGMGAVYKAEDVRLQRFVALKIPSLALDDQSILMRFEREARAAAQINHRNVCSVFDIGKVNGQPYLTMNYIDGKSLAKLIKEDAPLEVQRAVRILHQVAAGMAAAHKCGIIHRDLKPENIMIDEEGEPVIMDFGLALSINANTARMTQTGAIMGTPLYMSPEQVNDSSSVTEVSDIFALGIILFQTLTGKVPYKARSIPSLLHAILNEECPRPSSLVPHIPAPLDAIVLRCTQKRPAARYQSMTAVKEALSEFLQVDTPTVTLKKTKIGGMAAPPTSPKRKKKKPKQEPLEDVILSRFGKFLLAAVELAAKFRPGMKTALAVVIVGLVCIVLSPLMAVYKWAKRQPGDFVPQEPLTVVRTERPFTPAVPPPAVKTETRPEPAPTPPAPALPNYLEWSVEEFHHAVSTADAELNRALANESQFPNDEKGTAALVRLFHAALSVPNTRSNRFGQVAVPSTLLTRAIELLGKRTSPDALVALQRGARGRSPLTGKPVEQTPLWVRATCGDLLLQRPVAKWTDEDFKVAAELRSDRMTNALKGRQKLSDPNAEANFLIDLLRRWLSSKIQTPGPYQNVNVSVTVESQLVQMIGETRTATAGDLLLRAAQKQPIIDELVINDPSAVVTSFNTLIAWPVRHASVEEFLLRHLKENPQDWTRLTTASEAMRLALAERVPDGERGNVFELVHDRRPENLSAQIALYSQGALTSPQRSALESNFLEFSRFALSKLLGANASAPAVVAVEPAGRLQFANGNAAAGQDVIPPPPVYDQETIQHLAEVLWDSSFVERLVRQASQPTRDHRALDILANIPVTAARKAIAEALTAQGSNGSESLGYSKVFLPKPPPKPPRNAFAPQNPPRNAFAPQDEFDFFNQQAALAAQLHQQEEFAAKQEVELAAKQEAERDPIGRQWNDPGTLLCFKQCERRKPREKPRRAGNDLPNEKWFVATRRFLDQLTDQMSQIAAYRRLPLLPDGLRNDLLGFDLHDEAQAIREHRVDWPAQLPVSGINDGSLLLYYAQLSVGRDLDHDKEYYKDVVNSANFQGDDDWIDHLSLVDEGKRIRSIDVLFRKPNGGGAGIIEILLIEVPAECLVKEPALAHKPEKKDPQQEQDENLKDANLQWQIAFDHRFSDPLKAIKHAEKVIELAPNSELADKARQLIKDIR